MHWFDISTYVAGIERVVVVEIQVHRLTSIGIDVVKSALDRLVGGRRREIERKGAVKRSNRALRPHGINIVDDGGDEMGIVLRKCVGITRTGPEDGHPLSIIYNSRLCLGIERIQGRRRLLHGIHYSPFGLEGLGADSESGLTRRPASPTDV